MSSLPLPSSPYKGLAAFEDSALDALFFFGRDKDSQIIAANLMASRLTVLFGPTGVGKTSVLRAGVAHTLRQQGGVEVRIHSSWTGDAHQALANLEREPDRDLYLILDQFEEFFLYHEADRSFVGPLAEVLRRADLRANVLIGIREDSLALLDQFKSLIPNLLSNRLRLRRLDRAGGEAAIVKPLDRFNELVPLEQRVHIETGLVQEVLDQVAAGRVEVQGLGRGSAGDVATDEIEAPYLQLVMSRIWDVELETGSRNLRLHTLHELGGATQIVRDHLDRAMSTLSPRQRDSAAAMYNYLVTPSGTKIAHEVRDLAGYAGLGEDDARTVLGRLADERIVRAGTENGVARRYEIYHDVLADAVVGWRNRHEADRALRDAERHRRRAVLVAVAAVIGLVLVGAVALFALVERRHARNDARRAQARELVAAAGRELATNPQKSLGLALQAAELERGTHEEDMLRRALLAANELAVMRAKGPVRVARFSPGGRRIVTGSLDGKVRIYRAGSSRPLKVLKQGGPVTVTELSRDGKRLVTGGRDGTVHIWSSRGVLRETLNAGRPVHDSFFVRKDLVLTIGGRGVARLWRITDGRLVRAFPLGGGVLPKRAAVDPTGRFLATAGQDRFARVYSIETGRLQHRLPQFGFVHCVAFDPAGTLLFTCGHEGAARIWSIPGGVLLRRLRGPGPKSPVLNGVVAPNGILVGASVADGTARIWEGPTAFQVGTMFGHTAQVTQIAFSPTNRAVVTGSLDNTARTWVVNGRPVALLAGHTGPINAVEFSPDGRQVVTASDDGTARLWESGTEPELEVLARQPPITAFALSPDGARVLVGDARGVARVRRIGRARVVATIRAKAPITAVAFASNGPIVATRPVLSVATSSDWVVLGRSDGSVLVRAPGRKFVIATSRSPVTAVALSAGAERLAVGNANGVVTLWDPRARRKLRTFSGHRLAITSIAFSPTGGRLLTASRDHDVRTWNVRTGRVQQVRRWHVGPVGAAAFSRDGRWVVTAGPGTAGLGKASSDQRVRILHGPERMRPLVAAGFAGRDGQTIVTASKDGTIRMYRCDICGTIKELMALARGRLSAG